MPVRFALLALAAIAAAASAQAPVPFNIERAPTVSGTWSYSAQGSASAAAFIDAQRITRMTLRCDASTRRIAIEVTSPTPASSLTIWTTGSERALPVRFDPAVFRAVATVASMDPLLDAIAFSRGRIAVAVGGLAPLVVPSAPETARVVEDCRS